MTEMTLCYTDAEASSGRNRVMLSLDDLYAFGRERSVCDNSIWLSWLDLKDLAVKKSAFACAFSGGHAYGGRQPNVLDAKTSR